MNIDFFRKNGFGFWFEKNKYKKMVSLENKEDSLTLIKIRIPFFIISISFPVKKDEGAVE